MGFIELKLNTTLGAFNLKIDASLERAPITCVWGRSGSGKSTLLRIIAGLENRGVEQVKFEGQSWVGPEGFRPAHERSVVYLFQEGNLLPHLNVRQNLEFAIKRRRKKDSILTLEQCADRFDLQDLLTRKSDEVSGGEAQRVSLARAFLSSPDLILMDEPLSACDFQSKKLLLNQILKSKQYGIPIVYVTHSLEELSFLADNVLHLDAGKVVSLSEFNCNSSYFSSLFDRQTSLSRLIMRAGCYDSDLELQAYEKNGVQIFVKAKGPVPEGEESRLLVSADEVFLSSKRLESISALNQVHGRIRSLSKGQSYIRVTVETKVGDLVAHLTKKSVVNLDLSQGSECWAVLKSLRLDY